MQAVEVLRAEHEGVLTVLTQLERAVAAVEGGAPVPTAIFMDIEEFFAVFVDRCHHGKEEREVFPRLSGAARAAVERLEADHREGRALAADYAAAVRRYTPGDRAASVRLADGARAYAAFLRRHIADETTVLFPAMEQALAGDDAALAALFERFEAEEIGPGTHERLHGMIEGLRGRIDPWVGPPAAGRAAPAASVS